MMGDPFESLTALLPANYVHMARDAALASTSRIRHLVTQRKIPDVGWSVNEIDLFVRQIAAMDSNAFPGNVGAGERESRIFSVLVAQRNYNLGHGIGRSGDILAVQPKAVGSSLINHLTNHLVSHALSLAGIQPKPHCFITPFATGMALTMCFLRLRHMRPNATHVIATRVDQKSHLKSVEAAGFRLCVVANSRRGDEITTDASSVAEAAESIGVENVVAVLAVTSCFAPRAPDDLPTLSTWCKDQGVPLVVNNAYGVQSSKCVHLVNEARRVGRLDVFVQSCDKNFMVPVGGAVIAGFDKEFVDSIAALYPGRASCGPSLDVLMTLLELGVNRYKQLLSQRKTIYEKLKSALQIVAAKHGERILETKSNNISLAFTLDNYPKEDVSKLGSMLFTRNVSGARVVSGLETKTVADVRLCGWGAHADDYPSAYLTVAAAIGMKPEEVDIVAKRLDKALQKFKQDL